MFLQKFSFYPLLFCLLAQMDLSAMDSPQDTIYRIYRDTFCGNQTVLINNNFYGSGNPTGTEFLPGAAVNGSDSLIQVDLVFRQPVEVNFTGTLCTGDTVVVNGTRYHANFFLGEEIVDNGSVNGCDSIIHVNLTFLPSLSITYAPTLCEGELAIINGHIYNALYPNGTEVMSSGSGCDSTIYVQLNYIALPYREVYDTLCPDGFLLINGTRYDRDNNYGLEMLPGASVQGCDSLVYIQLSFREIWTYLGADITVVKGDTICLVPTFGFMPVSLAWTPDVPCTSPDCDSVCLRVLSPLHYTVLATDENGCVASDDININISLKNHVFAPNIFSPDAAYPNNYFYLSPDGSVTGIRRMFIADRWGEVVFERRNMLPDTPTDGWDGEWQGKKVQSGTYMYWAEFERFDGSTFTQSGDTTVIR